MKYSKSQQPIGASREHYFSLYQAQAYDCAKYPKAGRAPECTAIQFQHLDPNQSEIAIISTCRELVSSLAVYPLFYQAVAVMQIDSNSES
jgi:hypothetical protein